MVRASSLRPLFLVPKKNLNMQLFPQLKTSLTCPRVIISPPRSYYHIFVHVGDCIPWFPLYLNVHPTLRSKRCDRCVLFVTSVREKDLIFCENHRTKSTLFTFLYYVRHELSCKLEENCWILKSLNPFSCF